jgi:hypothetical protein
MREEESQVRRAFHEPPFEIDQMLPQGSVRG